ncbi:hypothetical protein K7432_009049 [Basidiobolus ranarum]|uniref:Uncharacterized protein n=1 Tax=Basidiobolus ranarum TaxID=34480 RepID=A0ABR2WQW5_9FUNG
MLLYQTISQRFSVVFFLGLIAFFIPCITTETVTEENIDTPCTDLYCSPTFNETWTVGSSQKFIWNPNYGTLVWKSTVDIYLYDMGDTRQPFKTWLGYDNQGTLPIDVTSEYFADIPSGISGANLIKWYRFTVVTSGQYPNISLAGPIFKIHDTITDTATIALTTTITETVTLVPSGTVLVPLPSSLDFSSDGVSSNAISVITGSILGALVAGIYPFVSIL